MTRVNFGVFHLNLLGRGCRYREKFGFPFVLCAREAQAGQLAVALRSRLLNEKEQELQAGRREVKKIARMRLLELVVA